MNFPTDKSYQQEEEKEKENVVDFAAILTEKEKEVSEVDILDTALVTFQTTNNKDKKDDLKYAVKVTDTDKIKEVHIDIEKPSEKERKIGQEIEKKIVVAELYKSEIPSRVVMGTLCNGTINSQQLKGPLHGKNTKELVRKIEAGEAYVDILTEDKPKGKIRGKIKKLAPA